MARPSTDWLSPLAGERRLFACCSQLLKKRTETVLRDQTWNCFWNLCLALSAGEEGSQSGRSGPEPVIQWRAPVGGDAVRTLQQFLNWFFSAGLRAAGGFVSPGQANSQC